MPALPSHRTRGPARVVSGYGRAASRRPRAPRLHRTVLGAERQAAGGSRGSAGTERRDTTGRGAPAAHARAGGSRGGGSRRRHCSAAAGREQPGCVHRRQADRRRTASLGVMAKAGRGTVVAGVAGRKRVLGRGPGVGGGGGARPGHRVVCGVWGPAAAAECCGCSGARDRAADGDVGTRMRDSVTRHCCSALTGRPVPAGDGARRGGLRRVVSGTRAGEVEVTDTPGPTAGGLSWTVSRVPVGARVTLHGNNAVGAAPAGAAARVGQAGCRGADMAEARDGDPGALPPSRFGYADCQVTVTVLPERPPARGARRATRCRRWWWWWWW